MMLEAIVVDGRVGYKNDGGLIFATPVNAKRVSAWADRMRSKGYKFP